MVHLTRERNIARAAQAAAQQARDGQLATAMAASEQLARQAARAAEEGRFAEAEMRADAAATILPDGPWGQYALGVLAFERQQLADATERFQQALRFDASHRPAKAALDKVRAMAGDLASWERLVAHLDEADDWRVVKHAADGLMAARRYREAKQAYRRALDLMAQKTTLPEASRQAVTNGLARAEVCVKTEGFAESLRGLPPNQQAWRVREMVQELWPNARAPTVRADERGVVHINSGGIPCLDPFRGLPLRSLRLGYSSFTDLSPLRGMPLVDLWCYKCAVRDLRPLRGLPLETLAVAECRNVSDLGPLEGMRLKELHCQITSVEDLAPLRNMPLEVLNCSSTRVSDLGPLAGMPLRELHVCHSAVSSLGPLKGMPLRILLADHTRVADVGPLRGMPLARLDLRATRAHDLTPLGDTALTVFWPPPRKQLTPESLKVIEQLDKRGCKIVW
jgi:hypothetical protein